jgi:hypothetical protein
MSIIRPARRIALIPFFMVLGCAAGAPASAAPTNAQQARAANAAPEHEPRTIRFGDAAAGRKLTPIFPDTTYDAAVPTPDSQLRQPLGTFTAHHAEIVSYLRALEKASPRVRVATFGRTHEGRELVWAAIGLPENIRDLDTIRANLGKLADPRQTSTGDADRIAEGTPAVAWLGYSIHGDEMSGSDASMAVAHHFAAGTSADVTDLLKDVVVVIDPCLNPDGRERILSQLEQGAGYVQNLDADSMNKGRWPYGRGNHYLFDMNRDWIFGTQPETRARWIAIQSFHPQLLVDAHEMGALDSFLFYPATDPINPYFPAASRKWWQTFGDEQGAAFDRHGWSYYTREWADSWYIGYSDSWGTFNGAIGILYEQARFMGQSVRRESGEIATYREAVERQAVSSLANVTTLAKNRREILKDYAEARRRNVSAESPGNGRAFVLVPGRNADREQKLVEMLLGQSIEVYRADAAFTGRNVETTLAGKKEEHAFPKGSLIVPSRQPLASLVLATLAFDQRYDSGSLNRERKELERKRRSKSYDVTGWSPAHGFDVDGYWCDALDVSMKRVQSLDPRASGVVPLARAEDPVYGWVVDGNLDAAVVFAAHAMELGVKVQISDEPFSAMGRQFPRWSLLVRRHENDADVAERVAEAARAARVEAIATSSARSRDAGPDLGGQHFDLLARPRVALLSNAPVGTDSFGHTWHLIDAEIGLPCTLIDAQSFGSYDLRRYNVLIVPEAWGDLDSILKANGDALRTWIKGGGTLIASGSAAATVCNKELGLSSVRLRHDALDDLENLAVSVRREREAGKTPVDEAALWGDKPASDKPAADKPAADKPAADKPAVGKSAPKDANAPSADAAAPSSDDTAKKDDSKKPGTPAAESDAKRRDRYARTFSPHGVIVRGEVNSDIWLTAGCDDEMGVFFDGSSVFVSELPVRTAIRLAAADRLRLSGLLWPEARERLADSAYATVESSGAGQVILFATPPDFRAWFPATTRLLANAIVYGPGVGANQPLGW